MSPASLWDTAVVTIPSGKGSDTGSNASDSGTPHTGIMEESTVLYSLLVSFIVNLSLLFPFLTS